MSVMIKGMNFPKNCMECDLHFIARGLDNECIFSNDTVDDCTERRLYRCLLVEIPTPHGRLIDADRLKEMIEQYHCNGCDNYNGARCSACWVDDCFTYIDDTPTIIEAEHESEAQRWARVGRDISKGLQEGIEAIDSEGIEE